MTPDELHYLIVRLNSLGGQLQNMEDNIGNKERQFISINTSLDEVVAKIRDMYNAPSNDLDRQEKATPNGL